MKKTIKLMLATALLSVGSMSTNAQTAVGDQFNSGNYRYQVTKIMVGTSPGEVTMIDRRAGRPEEAFVNAEGQLEIPETVTVSYEDEVYTFNVAAITAAAMQNHATATSVVIPARLQQIPANCFNGCSSLTSITFQANSKITTIGVGAFATTRIANFDFSPCTKLLELPDGVFAEGGGLTNSYITTITLPGGTQFKHINGALKKLTALTTINNMENSNLQELIAQSFDGCTNLKTLSLPGSIKYIDKAALKGSSVENLTVNVTSLQYLGGGTVNADYTFTPGAAASNLYDQTTNAATPLKSLTLTGNLGGKICTWAFAKDEKIGVNNTTQKFDISGLNFISQGQIQANAFLDCKGISSITLGDITDNGMAGAYTIAADAFKGCPIGSVTIGDITTKDAIGAEAFGNELVTVTTGSIKADDGVFAASAFKFKNNAGNWLVKLGSAAKALNANVVSAGTEIIPAGAFDFSAVAAKPDGKAWPAIEIGKITSKGAIFDATTPSFNSGTNNKIEKITFKGSIIQNGIDACPVAVGEGLKTVIFEGPIETGGVGAAAFTNVAALVNLTFQGPLAELAVSGGAFQGTGLTTVVPPLYSTVTYTAASSLIYDLTVCPFAQDAFFAAWRTDAQRNITLSITATEVLDLIKVSQVYDKVDGYNGTGAATTVAQRGEDMIFGVFFPVVITPDLTFKTYVNANDKKTAWARWELGARVDENVTGTIAAGTDLVIKRVNDADGGKVKLTLYGTYTDEDDALNASTIYMVPLKVKNGFYHIPGTNHTTLIAKVEKATDFTIDDVKIPVNGAGYPAYGTSSIWNGLVNDKLFVASNVMTNQQLIDNHATDAVSPAGGLEPWGYYHNAYNLNINGKDLYIMTDPSKHKGFRIDKNEITKENGAYIYTGWYYMLLKHYNGDPAAARVVWMDDNNPDAIESILMKGGVVNTAVEGNDAIYNLQGMQISAPVKGQIYIKNGKKYFAK